MLNISREYSHNLNTAVPPFFFFSVLHQHTQLQLQWILHWEWDLRAIPFGVLFCRLPICHKSSLLCSWSLRPCLPSPGGNTIRCRGHFIHCHCPSTAVIRKKKKCSICPRGENSGLLGNLKKWGEKGKKWRRERRRDEQNYCGKNLQSCCQRRYKLSLWWVTMLWKICIGDKGFVSFLCLFNELHLSTPYPQLFN